MSLDTDAKPQADYSTAFAILDALANDASITPLQRQAAQDARTKLTLEFIGRAQASFEKRTEQYRAFVTAMNSTINQLASGSIAKAVQGLTGIVTEAGGLLAAVKAGGYGGPNG